MGYRDGNQYRDARIFHPINRLNFSTASAANFKAVFGDNVIVNFSSRTLICCRELSNPCYIIIKIAGLD